MSPPGPARITDNPFYVLGLPPSAPRAEVEREGQKLLGMLELGLKQAAVYDTPLGPRARDADMVRAAMADLRDPDRRLTHELWATLPVSSGAPGASWRSARHARQDAGQEAGGAGSAEFDPAQPGERAPWEDALVVLGWRRP